MGGEEETLDNTWFPEFNLCILNQI
jgi:hypothetical protein